MSISLFFSMLSFKQTTKKMHMRCECCCLFSWSRFLFLCGVDAEGTSTSLWWFVTEFQILHCWLSLKLKSFLKKGPEQNETSNMNMMATDHGDDTVVLLIGTFEHTAATQHMLLLLFATIHSRRKHYWENKDATVIILIRFNKNEDQDE